jgi:hypothetical protein
MAEFFFNMMLAVAFIVGLGSWSIGKLLNKNPQVKEAATSGVVSLIKRFLR